MKILSALLSLTLLPIILRSAHAQDGWLDTGSVVLTTEPVGIRVQSPGQLLDVGDRIRLRQGPNGPNDSAGLWLFQSVPQRDQAFVGMANDTQVGLWGNLGAQWGLTMDVASGNVGIGTSPENLAKLSVSEPFGVNYSAAGFFSHDSCEVTGFECEALAASLNGSLGGVQAYANLAMISNGQALAGEFGGDVEVTGMLMKGGGGFQIDHPLDPKNKLLNHSFVESPDMMNLYDGIATLGSGGEATVKLPSYFQSLNSDYRYSLTALGEPAPGLFVKEEIKNNQFVIAGGRPSQRVSWLVTGIRQDAFAKAHRIVAEAEKGKGNRHKKGKYLHPKAFGKDPEKDSESGERMKALKRKKSP
jgi:hypothetical protein